MTDVTCDQAINQSDNQPINQQHHSYLSHLLPPLFAIVCEYLDLECKCRCLPVLSNSIKLLFNPALCCKGRIVVDFKSFKCRDTSAYCRALTQFAYAPYASSVSCAFTRIREQQPEVQAIVLQTMLAVLDNPALHSLVVNDDMGEADFSTIHAVLTKLAQMQPSQLPKLRVLDLRLRRESFGNSSDEPFHSLDSWGGLCNCTSLMTFNFYVYIMPDNVFESILDDLSDSLTELTVKYSHTSHMVLNRKLMSPTFLPHLRRLPHPAHITQKLFVGLSTVMTNTGRPRPIEEIDMVIEMSGLSFHWCNQVHTLDVKYDIRFMDDLCGVTDDVLPLLRCFSLTVIGDRASFRCDISPVIAFASKRPIESLAICGMHWHGVDLVHPHPSYISIKHLASMTSLTSLSLSNMCLRFPVDMCVTERISMLPAGSWPHLANLTMINMNWNPETAICFIQAAPKLTELLVRFNVSQQLWTFSWIPLVPVVAHCCPDIVSFMVESFPMSTHRPAEGDDLFQLQAAYASWPLASNGFQRLQKLQIDDLDAETLATRWGLFEHSFDSSDLFMSFIGTSARFRTLSDVPAGDGRQIFFDRLYCRLKEIEQNLMN